MKKVLFIGLLFCGLSVQYANAGGIDDLLATRTRLLRDLADVEAQLQSAPSAPPQAEVEGAGDPSPQTTKVDADGPIRTFYHVDNHRILGHADCGKDFCWNTYSQGKADFFDAIKHCEMMGARLPSWVQVQNQFSDASFPRSSLEAWTSTIKPGTSTTPIFGGCAAFTFKGNYQSTSSCRSVHHDIICIAEK